MSDIFSRRSQLEKERRDEISRCMAEYDKIYHEKMKAVQLECKNTKGHHWKYIHRTGIFHDREWYICSTCGESKYVYDEIGVEYDAVTKQKILPE